MTSEPRAMKEIHDIRLKIYEDIKDMTEEEVSEYYKNASREVEMQYGIKLRRPGDPPAGKVV